MQTNIVRQDGRRGVLITIIKSGTASTLNVVKGIRDLLPRVAALVPPQLKITPLADQSVFVRGANDGVVRESVIAAALTGLMILLFLGSWRSTIIIAISIPLSILTSVIVLSFLARDHQHHDAGRAGVGRRHPGGRRNGDDREHGAVSRRGAALRDAILEGAAQIAVPALVSTLCICIVFLPMFFLGGVARFLFVPLAEAVVFAMLASYVLSRTLVPTLAMYLLRLKDHDEANVAIHSPCFSGDSSVVSNASATHYRMLLTWLVAQRKAFIPIFLLACLSAFALVPWLGQDFFPSSDSGQFILHVRAKTGTRIEETARLCDLVENSIRREIPPGELDNILDNMVCPTAA